jgi:hypothetical protein
VGELCNQTYKNIKGQTVSRVFRGLRDLNVIHDPLEHGAEIMWHRRERLTPKGVEKLLTDKNELGVFSKITPLSGMNTMSESIANELKGRLSKRGESQTDMKTSS